MMASTITLFYIKAAALPAQRAARKLSGIAAKMPVLYDRIAPMRKIFQLCRSPNLFRAAAVDASTKTRQVGKVASVLEILQSSLLL
jgi:hypothetical protein